MALNEIDIFLAAIRRLESGTFAGNYVIRGEEVKTGQYAGEKAMGAYQIMPGNWAGWAREAGIGGADWQSKAAQDAVARFKMTQYYNELGDWRLVAIAWFSGLSRARTAQAQGVEVLAGVRDVNGTSVPGYVDDIVKYMYQAQDLGYGPKRSDELVGKLDGQARDSIRSGRLSIDRPLFGAGDMGQSSALYEPSVPSANPNLDPLRDLAGAERQVRRGNQLDPEFMAKDMHKNMAGILQGISNSIKAGAAVYGTGAPISDGERQLLEIDPNEREPV